MTLAINPNIAKVRQSATLAIHQRAMALRAQGQEVAHFGFGQSPFAVHPSICDALAAHSAQKNYLPTLGLMQLRAAIASYFTPRGYSWQAADIVIGPGSKELLFDLLFTLDGVLLLPVPCWVSYYPQAQIIGRPVVPVQGQFAQDYKLTVAALEQASAQADAKGKRQKILILNSPNNPVGHAYSEAEFRRLAAYIVKQNILVLADEIYASLYFAAPHAPSMAFYAPRHTIVTSSLSKAFAGGGYRLGFAAIPPPLHSLLSPLAALISETFSCVSAPMQHAACHAYSDDAAINAYMDQCTKAHSQVTTYVHARLSAAGLACPKTQGGFYLFPNFNDYADVLHARGIHTSRQLCDALLEEARVVLLPAEDFGMPPDYLAARLAPVDYDGDVLLSKARDGKLDLAAAAPNIVRGCDALTDWMRALGRP